MLWKQRFFAHTTDCWRCRLATVMSCIFLILSIVRNPLSNHASLGTLYLVSFLFMSCFPYVALSFMNSLCFSWPLCVIKMILSFVHLEPAVYLSAHINGPALPKWVLVLRFIPLLTQFYTAIMGKINIELRFHNKCLSPSMTFSNLRSTLNKSICWNRQNVGLM